MASGPGLESLVDQTISVITNDGRNIVGVLKGFDQATNIILDESHERVYSTKVCDCILFSLVFIFFEIYKLIANVFESFSVRRLFLLKGCVFSSSSII